MTIGPKAFPDHFLSVYQSAVDAVARGNAAPLGDAEVKALPKGADAASAARAAAAQLAELRFRGRIYSPEGERKSVGTVLTCASLGLKYLEALVKGDAVAARAIEGKLGDAKCDPGWASTLGQYYSSYLSPNGGRRPIPYRRPATLKTNVITIKPDARIAIVGDWGTGGGPAITVARQIAQLKPDILVHLGDIYYSGTQHECQANFLDVVDKVFDRANTRLPIYTLAGNHDMYSGGEGFYALIDILNQGDMRQRASFFCLRSADSAWQLLGMDTGLNDYSPLSVTDTLTHLEPDEEQWHFERIAEFPGRTILLSHHQLFSAFSQIGAEDETARLCAHNPKLLASYKKFLSTGRSIPAWFWGHEHSLYLYEPYLDLPKGRCLGHGAIPVFVSEDPYEALPKLVNPPALIEGPRIDSAGDVYGNGFAVLQLDPIKRDAAVTYYQDIQGETAEIFSEMLGQTTAPIVPSRKTSKLRAPAPGVVYFAPQSSHKSAGVRRVAFVLGNQDYAEAPKLTNPSSDAHDIRAELEKLGFDVFGGINFDLKTMDERFNYFESQLAGADAALLYYSGHGVQIDGQNYLVPVDVGVDALLAPKQQMQVQSLVNRMAHQDRKCIVLLDACRDNPFLESIVEPTQYAKRVGSPTAETIVSFMSHGLAPVDVKGKSQAFIAFAAAPGKYAYGSKGRRSNFTEGLITHLDTQGLSIDGLMNRVRALVKETTNDAQDPWSQTNLAEEYYLRPPPVAPIIGMTLLGMLAAFITSWRTFDETGRFVQGWDGWGGFFFGLAVAGGVWLWGRRSAWAVLFALVCVTISYKLGYTLLEAIGTFDPHKRSENVGPFFENTYLMRDVIGALLAAVISVLGTICGVAIWTPALRQLRSLVMLLLAGVVVGVILMAVTKAQAVVFPWVDKDAMARALAFIGAMTWQGLLGFTIGYGFSRYVPQPWERTRSSPFGRLKWI